MKNPVARIGLAVLLIVLGLALMTRFFPLVLLLGLGALLAWRSRQEKDDFPPIRLQKTAPPKSKRLTLTVQDDRSDFENEPRQKVYSHALRAVESAGLDPDALQVLPVDLGLMVFQNDADPLVYRTQPIYDDIDYLQPFVLVRVPQKAVGKIKFEIIDSDGQTIFMREEQHTLQRGRNLITPAARLPIHDAQPLRGAWQLRISADNLVLATHTFRWAESELVRVRRQIAQDGELSNELRAALDDSRLQDISLDDLLSYQDDQADSRRNAS